MPLPVTSVDPQCSEDGQLDWLNAALIDKREWLTPDATPGEFLSDLAILVIRRSLNGLSFAAPGSFVAEINAAEAVLWSTDAPLSQVLPEFLDALKLPTLANAIRTINARGEEAPDCKPYGLTLAESYQVIDALHFHLSANEASVQHERPRTKFSDTVAGTIMKLVDRAAGGPIHEADLTLRLGRQAFLGSQLVIHDQLIVDLFLPRIQTYIERNQFREAADLAHFCRRELRDEDNLAGVNEVIRLCEAKYKAPAAKPAAKGALNQPPVSGADADSRDPEGN